jgi:hypothetical protein
MKLSSVEKTNIISDFFIMRKYRRRGVGKEVAISLFEQFHGTWEIRQTFSNKNAYEFWKHVIKKYKCDGAYQEEMIQNNMWNETGTIAEELVTQQLMQQQNVLGKATCFITRKTDTKIELLLIQHPNAGIQLPAGTVEINEDFKQAALREAYCC